MEIAITIVTTTRTDGSFNSESERYNRSFRSDLRERILSAQFIEGSTHRSQTCTPFCGYMARQPREL